MSFITVSECHAIERAVRAKNSSWHSPIDGEHGITYGEDDFGAYATVAMSLPARFYAEIEDGTCGQMTGLRLYLAEIN